MTTFTTEDRIIAEKDGSVTINVEPIPFAGLITITESAPKSKPVAWIDTESNINMIGGIYPKKLEQYLNSLEARIKELEAILKKAQEK